MVLFPLWGRSDGLTLANFPTREQLSSRINKKRWGGWNKGNDHDDQLLGQVWRWTNEGRLCNTMILALVLFEMDKTKYLGRRSSFLDAHPVVHVVQPRKKPEAEIIHELWRLSGDSRFRKVWYLHYLTPRSSIIQGAIIWKEFGLECCNVVISELSARIYKSFSFSGSGSWIWLLLCVLSMCAYNSSRVESADSEMIPPFQVFQSHSNPANSAKDPVQQASNFNSCASVYGRKSINDTRCNTILLRVSWEWLWISIICRLLICMIVDGRGPVGEAWGSSLYIDHKQTFYATHDNLAAKVEHQYLPSLLVFACQ